MTGPFHCVACNKMHFRFTTWLPPTEPSHPRYSGIVDSSKACQKWGNAFEAFISGQAFEIFIPGQLLYTEKFFGIPRCDPLQKINGNFCVSPRSKRWENVAAVLNTQ